MNIFVKTFLREAMGLAKYLCVYSHTRLSHYLSILDEMPVHNLASVTPLNRDVDDAIN